MEGLDAKWIILPFRKIGKEKKNLSDLWKYNVEFEYE